MDSRLVVAVGIYRDEEEQQLEIAEQAVVVSVEQIAVVGVVDECVGFDVGFDVEDDCCVDTSRRRYS